MPRTDPELRQLVGKVLRAGALPRRDPDRTWGGDGVGAACTICEEVIRPDQREYEVQFARDGSGPGVDRFHMHPPCFMMWELERATVPN